MQAVEEIIATIPLEGNLELPGRSVLFVSHSFPPSMEIGANSCAQIARNLPQYGWQPVVLTIQDKYIDEEYQPRGANTPDVGFAKAIVKTRVLPHPFDVYRWVKSLFSSSKAASPTIEAGAKAGEDVSGERKGRLRMALLSLFGIPDLHTGWLIPAVFAGMKAIRQNNVQTIFSSAPCFTGHLVAYALARLSGLPWIAHFRDPWITAEQPGWYFSPLATKANRTLERMVIGRANRVISVTEGHCVKLREAYPQYQESKFSAIPNGFDSEEWTEIDLDRKNTLRNGTSRNERFTILYAGQFYAERNPVPLFKALRTLVDSGEIELEHVQVDLVGWCETSGGRNVSDLIAESNLQGCVNLVGRKSRQETLRRMTKADLLLLLAEGLTVQIPGKTYEYLKAGRPILAFTSEGELRNLIRNTGCGWSVDPADQKAIEAALREAYTDWRLGQVTHVLDAEAVARFDRRWTTRQIGNLFDQLVDQALTETVQNER